MARDDPHGRLRAVRVSPVPVSEFPVTTCRRSCSAREARAVRRPYTSKPLSPLPSFLASVIEGRTHHRLPIAAIIEAASGPSHQFPAAAAPSGFRGNDRLPSDGQAARGLSESSPRVRVDILSMNCRRTSGAAILSCMKHRPHAGRVLMD
jgi:hypothetical protein